ncbi:MAG: B12-binding domain-containing radical SAM protein [Promethearchaeota archaeon]
MKPEILLFHPPNVLDHKALKYAIMSPLMCGYGLLHIGAHLKEKGYRVECWNIPLAYYLGFNTDHIREIIKGYNPLLIGIELNWLHLSKGALDLAKMIKEILPNTPIIVGGVHATLFAEQIIQSNEPIDIVVKGEAEKIMEDLSHKIEKEQDYSEIIGIVTKKNGKIIKNEGKNIYDDIDLIPPYAGDFLMPKTLNPYELAAINTCRGPCTFNCVYCIGAKSCYPLSPRKNIAFHSVSWVIKQIKILLDYVRRISIQDYNYCNPKFISELAQAIREENLQDSTEYFNYALVPTVKMNKPILHDLARAGVDNIDVGIETGSDYLLKTLNRPYNTQQAFTVIKNAIESGILPKTYWMITGLERKSDLDANKKFLKETIEMGAVPKWVTSLCILPKTQLYNNAKKYNVNLKLNSFKDYMVFSTEKANRSAYYAHCITHETDSMSIYDILKAVNDLKTLILHEREVIFEKLEENKKYYQSAKPNLYEDMMIQRARIRLKQIRGSFY